MSETDVWRQGYGQKLKSVIKELRKFGFWRLPREWRSSIVLEGSGQLAGYIAAGYAAAGKGLKGGQ